ncbi:hypothetical protein PpBr36_04742 [Pyricularia pennisetigena]|uniref:hypothetical protein n=1 Tax=Pyricularia pennisetigena TaxID=1578925 RepID=UPI00114E0BDE|nr:hypothetical protein PpBr36_04742 [Pyricularia pennisetigena]TLS26447.1 hypothetical protein PpBr36_04742 [Pyricularia pennisetigena]
MAIWPSSTNVDTVLIAEAIQTCVIPGCLPCYQTRDGEVWDEVIDVPYLVEGDSMAMNLALAANCDGLMNG